MSEKYSNKAKQIRARIIGSISKPGLLVSVTLDGEPLEVELKQPSLELKGEIARAAGARFEDGGAVTPDIALFTAHIIARCAYEPGTLNRLFSTDDVEMLLAHGPELDGLSQAALSLLQGEVDAKKESKEITSSEQNSGLPVNSASGLQTLNA